MKKITTLFLIVLLSLTVCKANYKIEKKINMFGIFKKTDNIEKFWIWFIANQSRLRNFQKNPDKYLTEVLSQIKKIKNGLAIEFEPPKNNIIGMTISADGDRNLFEIVQKIVSKAPEISGWKIIAFRQRMDLEEFTKIKLEAEGQKLEPDKMKFFPVIQGDTLDIIIYSKGINEKNFNQIAYGGLILLDNILGEYDCVMKVRSYDFQNLPTKKEELEGLQPLIDLAKYVDNFHKTIKH